MRIRINNWDKHNPRKDLKTLTWLRLDGDIGFNESLFGLSAEAKWFWIFVLSFSAKKNSGEFEIDESYFSFHSSVPKNRIADVITAFVEKGLVEVIPDSSRIRTDTIESVSYDTIRNDTGRDGTEQDDTEQTTPDEWHVLNFWNSKKIIIHSLDAKRIKHVKEAIKKNGRPIVDIFTAIENYAKIIHGHQYYFKHKWSLKEFLTRETAEKFFGENFVEANYLKKGTAANLSDYAQDMIENGPYASKGVA